MEGLSLPTLLGIWLSSSSSSSSGSSQALIFPPGYAFRLSPRYPLPLSAFSFFLFLSSSLSSFLPSLTILRGWCGLCGYTDKLRQVGMCLTQEQIDSGDRRAETLQQADVVMPVVCMILPAVFLFSLSSSFSYYPSLM